VHAAIAADASHLAKEDLLNYSRRTQNAAPPANKETWAVILRNSSQSDNLQKNGNDAKISFRNVYFYCTILRNIAVSHFRIQPLRLSHSHCQGIEGCGEICS